LFAIMIMITTITIAMIIMIMMIIIPSQRWRRRCSPVVLRM